MIDLGSEIQLVTRREWGAREPLSTSPITPTFGTTAHWEGPHMGWPWTHAACSSLVRGIQAFHMDSRRWVDIAYSYLVCGHGFVFEGRGIGRRTAANGTTVGNAQAYAVCYLGGEGDVFTEDGKRAMRVIMDFLDARGAGPGRNGHRDWKSTSCPGDTIYRWIRTGQPANLRRPSPPPAPIEEDAYMAVRKIEIANTNPQRYAYVLGDGTVVDTDHEGNPLVDGAASAGAFDAVYFATPNAVQIDLVQKAIARERARSHSHPIV